MKLTNVMTREAFVTHLSTRKGASPIGLLTVTEPKMRKTGNPHLGAKRITRRNAFIGGSYESIVNNAVEKAGGERTFEAQPLPWGTAVNAYLIENKGKLYLRYFPLTTGCKGDDRWEKDGQEIPVESIKPFLYESAPSNPVGVEWRTVGLDNVKEITLDGVTVTLV